MPNNVTSALVDGVGMSDPVIRYQLECALCMFMGGGLLPRVDLPKKSQHKCLKDPVHFMKPVSHLLKHIFVVDTDPPFILSAS